MDPERLLQLVGTVAPTSSSPSLFHVYLAMEYSFCGDPEGVGAWNIVLNDGGRATLKGEGWSMSVQPTYPKEIQAMSLLEAVKKLEVKIFGCVAPVSASPYVLFM